MLLGVSRRVDLAPVTHVAIGSKASFEQLGWTVLGDRPLGT